MFHVCVCVFFFVLFGVEKPPHLRKTSQQQNQQTNPKTILLPRCFFLRVVFFVSNFGFGEIFGTLPWIFSAPVRIRPASLPNSKRGDESRLKEASFLGAFRNLLVRNNFTNKGGKNTPVFPRSHSDLLEYPPPSWPIGNPSTQSGVTHLPASYI